MLCMQNTAVQIGDEVVQPANVGSSTYLVAIRVGLVLVPIKLHIVENFRDVGETLGKS